MTFWSILRQRCWGLVLVVAGVCVITFIISHLIPGDPARLLAGDRASDAIVENIRQQLGLDQPLYVQFYRYVSDLFHGDLGTSIRTGRPVLEEEMQIPDAVEVMSRYPLELSGGMRQRVMIALAFSCEPQLIIADEPTTALDVTVQLQVLRLLKHKARASGTAVLFISHDMAVVSQLCDSVYVMYAGSVIESGVTADVIHHPRHPYTIGLLQCAPEHGIPRQPLPAIPGTVPNLTHLPDGCAFRDRCYAAGAQCENVPALTACGDNNQRCACWYPQQEVISV
ncbi:ATP-binding cassette domain-containing protein [Escherichia coli]|nr:ATP-binding cassette domain-containing protein [Escherichia coli]HEF0705648.1 ATP-binding cassette domain-containing protein [Escherichia coli]